MDPFAEPNLAAAAGPDGRVLIIGVTHAKGNADVFWAGVDPVTGLP